MLRHSHLWHCHVVGIKYHLSICMSLLKGLWLLNNAFRHLDQEYFDLVKRSFFRYLKFRLYKFNDPACFFFELLLLFFIFLRHFHLNLTRQHSALQFNPNLTFQYPPVNSLEARLYQSPLAQFDIQ